MTESWAAQVAAEQDMAVETAAANGNGSGVVQVEQEVEVRLRQEQNNAVSPLYSAKSFEELGLHPDLLKGIYNMKFQKPSKIQEKALPLLLRNPPENMIAQSQSGTGKTAAFSLTALSRVDPAINAPQAIILSPSRELARQTMEVIKTMGKFTSITYAEAIAGVVSQKRNIEAQIIVGTPGTVGDLIRRRMLNTQNVRVLVLDEADNMLSQSGLGDQSLRIQKMIPMCQVLLFSATFPDDVVKFAGMFAPNANEIRLKQEELTVDGIKQLYLDCPNEESKYEALVRLYGLLTIGQSIIFVRKREVADEIARRMTAEGHTVASLHGKIEGAARDSVMDDFRAGRSKVLITTNVIARGIDISQVSMVVNYDIPTQPVPGRGWVADPETYLHRIGRTGRFGRTGVSISFVHDKESWEQLAAIQNYFGKEMKCVPTDDWEKTEEIIKQELRS